VAPQPNGDTREEPVGLEAVDAVYLTALVDNLSDMLLLDQGPAKRVGVSSAAGAARIAEPLFVEGETRR
jgi:hypothetical protein